MKINQFDHRYIWCSLITLLGLIFANIRVPTSLGVKVPEVFGADGQDITDKSGREYVWRVWWRSRDNLFDVQNQWLVTVCLLVLLTTFVVALLAAVWIALTPDEPAVASIE